MPTRENCKDPCGSSEAIDARLKVIPQSDLPLRLIATIWVANAVRQVNGLAELIGNQNDGLNTSSCVVANSLTSDGKRNGCDLLIAIEQTSLQWLRVA